MPVVSAEPSRPRRTIRAVLRWLPAVVLAALVVVATGRVLDLEGPPTSTASIQEGNRPSTALLSLRRSLAPLRDAAADHALRRELDAFVASQPPDTCLQVEAGEVRYDHRGSDPQAPASLQKLLTAVAALTELGEDDTYETDVLSGPVTAGVVPGNLYLRGSGDPILATPAYVARERNQPQIFSNIDALADAVVDAGVTTITGSVVGDESRYDLVRYNPSLPSRLIAQGQVGPVSALSVNDGFAHDALDASGVFGPAPDPAAYAASVLDGALRARGIAIGGPPTSGTTPAEAVVTATLTSPPMSQIVTQMLRESDNNTAELLLKEIGFRRSGVGSFEAGLSATAAILDEAGIGIDGVVIADGSGLTTDNTVTCALVFDLLVHEPTDEVVRSALAVSGQTGTLAERWLGTDLVGRIRAKTGTLNQVTGLAGFADTAGGEAATFALLVNLTGSERIDLATIGAQQRLAEALVAHPDLPDVDHLRPGEAAGG